MTEVKGKKTMRDDDIMNVLADVLLGSGSMPRTEVEEKWTVCIVDERGKVKRYPVKSLSQAQATIREWNRAGWRPWIEDSKGEAFTLAKEPEGKN